MDGGIVLGTRSLLQCLNLSARDCKEVKTNQLIGINRTVVVVARAGFTGLDDSAGQRLRPATDGYAQIGISERPFVFSRATLCRQLDWRKCAVILTPQHTAHTRY